MRGLPAWCVVVSVVIGAPGCLDVPAHDTCLPGDHDCDGWLPTGGNPAAVDCDDDNPAINPGGRDDPMTAADEDCADGTGVPLVGVSGSAAGLTSGDLMIGFNSKTRMPSSVRLSNVELLAQQPSGCPVANEEGMGISLYPTFAAHLRTNDEAAPTGTFTVERSGPAMATARVEWTATVPRGDSGTACDMQTTLHAILHFTVLPNARLVRDDLVDVGPPVTSCGGCAGGSVTTPIFTSYLALDRSFDLYTLDGTPDANFETTIPEGMDRAFPGPATHRVCMHRTGAGRALAVTWHSDDSGHDVRLRQTRGTVAHALVFDWVRSAAVSSGPHHVVTTAIGYGGDLTDRCADLMVAAGEVERPTVVDGFDYRDELGVFEPIGATGGAAIFTPAGDILWGATIRTTDLGARGVTVWRQRDVGAAARLIRDVDYLVQHDDDGATVVYLPRVLAGDGITIAAPGHEPAP